MIDLTQTPITDSCFSCIEEDRIAKVIEAVDSLCGDPCVPDPQVFLDDTIPDVIKYSENA
jgi:hypothetical protein